LFCDPTFNLIKGREEDATGGVALECRGMAGVGGWSGNALGTGGNVRGAGLGASTTATG
jgi:hypothetical protein